MIQIVNGEELKHDILHYLAKKTGSAGEVWVKRDDVLEKIEKHCIGLLSDKCLPKRK